MLSFPKIYVLPFLVSSKKIMREFAVNMHLNDTTFHTGIATTRQLPQFLPKLGKT